MSALVQPPSLLSVRVHHKFRKIRSFFHEEPLPLVRKMFALDNHPNCGRLLWTTSDVLVFLMKIIHSASIIILNF